MIDIVKDAAIAMILAGVCAIVAYLLRAYKRQILAIVTDLIEKAEEAIEGSGMGFAKKAKVIAQLEAMGITVTEELSREIDRIVAYLNEKSGWFVGEATESTEDAPSLVTGG